MQPNSTHITRRLSGIHAAWHFWYAASLGVESGLRKLGLGGIHPLTRRYVLGGINMQKKQIVKYILFFLGIGIV
ncbi:hypothetical protein ACEV7T_24930, partial [Vibrio parahaemolyticus]